MAICLVDVLLGVLLDNTPHSQNTPLNKWNNITCLLSARVPHLFQSKSQLLIEDTCQLSIPSTDTWDAINLWRKSLLWLVVSRASVHGQLSLLLWPCGCTVHHGRSLWERKPVDFMAGKPKRMTSMSYVTTFFEITPPQRVPWLGHTDYTHVSVLVSASAWNVLYRLFFLQDCLVLIFKMKPVRLAWLLWPVLKGPIS